MMGRGTTNMPQSERILIRDPKPSPKPAHLDKKNFQIGIPKEHFFEEARMPLTPQGVELLVEQGHEIVVEAGAGAASHYADTDYSEVGAYIVHSHKEALQCDIVLKVGPLSLEEIDLLKNRATLISYLVLPNQSKETILKLSNKKINAIALELIKDEYDCYPVVRSISQIEGIAAIMVASEFLSNSRGGKGILLGGVTGITPTEVVILGAGTGARVAARTALGLGATVKVFDGSVNKLRELEFNLGQRIFTSTLHPGALKKALKSADVAVGTLMVLNGAHQFTVSEELVSEMKRGAVIVDLSMNQGGCFATSKSTTLEKPTYRKHGVIHYCVPNLSSMVSRTASIALSDILAPLLIEMGGTGTIQNFIKSHRGFRHGVYLFNGILTNRFIGDFFNLSYQDIELLITAF